MTTKAITPLHQRMIEDMNADHEGHKVVKWDTVPPTFRARESHGFSRGGAQTPPVFFEGGSAKTPPPRF
jgi:hypothetical protein